LALRHVELDLPGVTGTIRRMPGLGARPAAVGIDLDKDGNAWWG
jgi:formyltetrahydrofolate synthetase